MSGSNKDSLQDHHLDLIAQLKSENDDKSSNGDSILNTVSPKNDIKDNQELGDLDSENLNKVKLSKGNLEYHKQKKAKYEYDNFEAANYFEEIPVPSDLKKAPKTKNSQNTTESASDLFKDTAKVPTVPSYLSFDDIPPADDYMQSQENESKGQGACDSDLKNPYSHLEIAGKKKNSKNKSVSVSDLDFDKDEFLRQKEEILKYLGDDGAIARIREGFKCREGQVDMAAAWLYSLKRGSSLVCESGTGTGKTFAYLIPALLSGRKIIISTASKALQDQLVKKDLPYLCRLLNVEPSFMALKGFSNYLCRKKHHYIEQRFANVMALKFDEADTGSFKELKENDGRVSAEKDNPERELSGQGTLERDYSEKSNTENSNDLPKNNIEALLNSGANKDVIADGVTLSGADNAPYNMDEDDTKSSDDAEFTDEHTVLSDEELLDDKSVSVPSVITPEVITRLDQMIKNAEYGIEHNLLDVDYVEVNSCFSKEVVSKITCSSENCLRKKCRYKDECFPYMARAAALSKKIVVINHSLFFSSVEIDDPFDIQKPPVLLPKYQSVIFDEAHELPSVGREHLSMGVGTYELKKFKYTIDFIKRNFKNLPMGPFNDIYEEFRKAVADLMVYFLETEGGMDVKRNILYYKYLDYSEDENDPYRVWEERNEKFRELMLNLYRILKKLSQFFNDYKTVDDEYFSRQSLNFLQMSKTVVALMKLDEKSEGNSYYGRYVGAVDLSKRSFRLYLTPLEISDLFSPYLYKCTENKFSVLMTSATLCVNHNFKKFYKDLGAAPELSGFEVKSSFDYSKQAALLNNFEFPSVDKANRLYEITESLKELLLGVEGGIFFLTTSLSAVNDAYKALTALFKGKRKILCQNVGHSNSKLLHLFKEDGRAVLIGTSSFWAGVDVPGKALSLVVIDKLPFKSPSDPIYKARCNYYDADHKDSHSSHFGAISIPEAVIELRQGAGRLIRHEKDRGGLVICDPRLAPKPYGCNYAKIFLNSLPDMKYVTSAKEMLDFINGSNQDMTDNS
ncbi:MAG: ATP-dependent DNA helicase [Succinivibrio sp.]